MVYLFDKTENSGIKNYANYATPSTAQNIILVTNNTEPFGLFSSGSSLTGSFSFITTNNGNAQTLHNNPSETFWFKVAPNFQNSENVCQIFSVARNGVRAFFLRRKQNKLEFVTSRGHFEFPIEDLCKFLNFSHKMLDEDSPNEILISYNPEPTDAGGYLRIYLNSTLKYEVIETLDLYPFQSFSTQTYSIGAHQSLGIPSCSMKMYFFLVVPGFGPLMLNETSTTEPRIINCSAQLTPDICASNLI